IARSLAILLHSICTCHPSYPRSFPTRRSSDLTKADQEKLGLAIQKLAEEDPTFRTELNPETGQTTIKGMGELHLDILVDRMKREDRKSTRLNSSHVKISYAVFCLKKKKNTHES